TGTRGFAAPEDASVAVCVPPGTELSFAGEVTCSPTGLLAWRKRAIKHKTAIFRQINKERVPPHHDPLEFPDGQIVPLTFLCEGQQAPVLQLPAEPKTVVETEARRRAAFAGSSLATAIRFSFSALCLAASRSARTRLVRAICRSAVFGS